MVSVVQAELYKLNSHCESEEMEIRIKLRYKEIQCSSPAARRAFFVCTSLNLILSDWVLSALSKP